MRPVGLAGSRILLTGAAGGIGNVARSSLISQGARVLGIDVIATDGVIGADITDKEAVSSAVHLAAEELGGIDVLINNAGIGRVHDSGDFPDEDARAVMETNFFGAWNTTAAAMPYLLRAKGHVVNVSSGLAIVDLPYGAAYSASKRALAAYSAALALEYRGRLSVTTVYPGYIRTGIHDSPSSRGLSLETLVRADTLEGAGRALVRACTHRPTALTTSNLSRLELWAARRFPRSATAIIASRTRRWARENRSPLFLRHPDPLRWKDE